MSEENKYQKVYTPVFRVSFPDVFEPKGFEGNEPKYGVTMLFPKSLFEPIEATDTEQIKNDKKKIQGMLTIAKTVLKERFGGDKKKEPIIKAKYHTCKAYPFRDGDIERAGVEGYEGHYFARATTKRRPGLVDQKLELITDANRDDFYSGCYAIATINAYAYDTAGNIGASFGLNNLKKEGEGDPLGGGASSVFDDFGGSPSSASSDFENDDMFN